MRKNCSSFRTSNSLRLGDVLQTLGKLCDMLRVTHLFCWLCVTEHWVQYLTITLRVKCWLWALVGGCSKVTELSLLISNGKGPQLKDLNLQPVGLESQPINILVYHKKNKRTYNEVERKRQRDVTSKQTLPFMVCALTTWHPAYPVTFNISATVCRFQTSLVMLCRIGAAARFSSSFSWRAFCLQSGLKR